MKSILEMFDHILCGVEFNFTRVCILYLLLQDSYTNN